jgi:hypothetical protein
LLKQRRQDGVLGVFDRQDVALGVLIGHGLDDQRLGVLFSNISIPVKWPTQPPTQRVPPVLVPEIIQQEPEMCTGLQKSEAIILRPLHIYVVCRGTTLSLVIRK